MPKIVTGKFVADRLGVSQATVSMAMRNHKSISPQVRQKVVELANQLGYTPNAAARAMRTQRSHQIGVLVSELHNPYTGRKIEAIQEELVKHDYRVLLGLTDGQVHATETYLSSFSNGMVDGVINLDPRLDRNQLEKWMGGIPSVIYARSGADSPTCPDYPDAVRQSLGHLWDMGHRKIGFVGGCRNDMGVSSRLKGYQAFYQNKGFEPSQDWICYGNWRIEDGERLAAVLLAQGCTAAVAANDLMAIGVIRAVRGAGLNVPDDFSVVGFDDSPVALMTDPRLTTLRIPLQQTAQITVNALMDMLQGHKTKPQQIIKATLVQRQSTAPPKRQTAG